MLPASSWLLLIWTGIAATLFAAAVVAPLAARGARGALLYMRPATAPDALLLLLLGLVVYPAVYGFIVDLIHVSSIFTGAAIGLAHAIVLIFSLGVNRGGGGAVRAIIAIHVAYGAVLGFLYVTP